MAHQNGNYLANTVYMSSWGAPVYPETGHSYNALGGNDTVHGSSYNDVIQGGSGNDILYGNSGNDALVGQTGNDELYGGAGDDFLHGGSTDAGSDWLDGGTGNDFMSGGPGDDIYVHGLNGGVDTINDGLSEGGASGYGGGSDGIWFTGLTIDQLGSARPTGTDDLWLASIDDLLDGQISDGVIIQNFYANESNTFIETVYVSNGTGYSLAGLL